MLITPTTAQRADFRIDFPFCTAVLQPHLLKFNPKSRAHFSWGPAFPPRLPDELALATSDLELHPLTPSPPPSLRTTPPTPPTPPPTCSPAVSPPAAPAPPRRASKPSPRGVSPRPQRSTRSLLSPSSALTVPTPARWYVIDGSLESARRYREYGNGIADEIRRDQ